MNRRVQLRDLLFQKPQMIQAETNQQPVMIAHLMFLQRGDDLGNLLLGLALRKLGDLLRISVAVQQSLQHQLSGDSKNIAEYTAQFHVGVFQHLLDPIFLADTVLDDLLTTPRQIAQLP